MAQDIVSDGLNQIMNSIRIEKKEIKINKISKVLINLFKMMKEAGHIEYSVEDNNKKPFVVVNVLNLKICKTIKPRYFVGWKNIEKYLRRFLPSRNFGALVISTNKGLMTHSEAEENKIGGCLLAYFY